jgi:alpha-methylacyl-CoA racemase
MGPLNGLTAIEVASLAPGPFCGMVLADLGADVIRVDRPGGAVGALPSGADVLGRGRRSVAIDLKHCDGPGVVLRMVERADVLIEGFRPGVAERLGIGPAACLDRNPRLVYGRATGWGQEGPLAGEAGHDLDYLAVAGALHPIGPPERPEVPVNFVADFGGGGMLLAVGVLAALWERDRSGMGQVVDAAMVDGVGLLTAMLHGLRAAGLWSDERHSNLLDGGAPFYGVYETSDGRHVAVAALEPQFYEALLGGLGLAEEELPSQMDRARWPELRTRIAAVFRTRDRDSWEDVFAGTDACVAPVLTPSEAPRHPQAVARGAFIEVAGVTQPAPAPRFGRTPPGAPGPPPSGPGADARQVLEAFGFAAAEIEALRASGALG